LGTIFSDFLLIQFIPKVSGKRNFMHDERLYWPLLMEKKRPQRVIGYMYVVPTTDPPADSAVYETTESEDY
jgi:hypothetical protein